jgi:PAS domain S-box-containing protein
MVKALIVTALLSILMARIFAEVSWWLCAGFALEAALVIELVRRLTSALSQQQERLASAQASVRAVRDVERQTRVTDTVLSRLEEAAAEWAIVTLDREGRIASWGRGAAQLYGISGDALTGSSAATLFGAELGATEFGRLLSDARVGTSVRFRASQQRADGTRFDAEVEIRWLSLLAGDGFTVLIHDLSRSQAFEAAAMLAADTEKALREEADVANRQLVSLQMITDPDLDALSVTEAATALLDRLRAEIGADGVAIVRAGASRHRQGRTLLIHNDAARVREMSAVAWGADVSSLIAVPVVRGGQTEAVIEVAYLRARRSTEREIALIQVVAARAAGLLQDTKYAQIGAVA